MSSICLVISRYVLAAWIGAAVLFVMTSVAEVRSEDLSSATKSTLALLRFPYFYSVGFSLVGVSLVCEFLAGTLRSSRLRMSLRVLLLVTLGLMLVDYFAIYSPLAEMTRLESRPANFIAYHHYSRWINTLNVGLALLASILAQRTPHQRPSHQESSPD